jgi:hypothetical protein
VAAHAGKLHLRPLERTGGREVGIAGGVDLGGAEEHEVDTPPAGMIEQVGDRHLARAAVEVAQVLGAGMELRDVRIEGADAGEVGEARRVGGARRQDGERRGDAGRHHGAVRDLPRHGGHHGFGWAAVHAASCARSACRREA